VPLDPQAQPVRLAPSRANVTTVPVSGATVTLLAANANRKGASIYNASTGTLYVKLGTGASAVSRTIPMASGGYYEVPFGYTEVITGAWSDGSTGQADVTEFI
jgi:hypothetical protein